MSQDGLFDLAGAAEPAAPARATAGPLVVAATDGSARPNPGTAAGAWYVSEDCWSAIAVEGTSTNNVGELIAMRSLLEAVPANRPLHVVFDSTYAFNCVTTWVKGWSRGGRLAPDAWLTKDRKPVKNAELIAATNALLVGRTITWSKVKSHTSLTTVEHQLNREADSRASSVVEAVRAGLPPAFGPGWTG